jgi:hypothetical protein
MKKHYDEVRVLAALSKKVVIDFAEHLIKVNTESGLVGNGTWGKIDFLCNYCGWRWIRSKDAIVGAANVSFRDSAKTKHASPVEEHKLKNKKK